MLTHQQDKLFYMKNKILSMSFFTLVGVRESNSFVSQVLCIRYPNRIITPIKSTPPEQGAQTKTLRYFAFNVGKSILYSREAYFFVISVIT